MNQDNPQDRPAPASDDAVSAGQTPQTPETPQSAPSPAAGTPTGTPAAPAPVAPQGHHMPPTFASHAAGGPTVAPVPHGLATPGPAAAGVPGAAFGVPPHGTLPSDGTAPSAEPTAATKEKSRGGTRVAAFIVAAALVGGVAGFGGGALLTGLQDAPSSGTAQGPQTVTVNNPGSVNETTAVATEALPSVVTIEVTGSQEAGSGSGVIISKDGYVLTNTHVVTLGGAAADPTIRVTTSDGRIYEATVVGTDPIYDLAVIKLTGAEDLTPIEFADSSKLNVGDTAVALGAPLGLANSVTTGIVSALNRSIQIASSALPDSSSEDAPQEQAPENGQSEGPFQFDLPGNSGQQATESISIAVIQTDAAINHGNSGGALVNSKGELIGINVAIASSGNSEESGSIGIGFAIPSNIAQRVSEEIIADGAATHGLLGASVRDASAVEGATVAGAYIAEVTDGGAAAAAGLQAGDVVTRFNGVPITSATDLTAQVRAAAADSKADVTYVRNGKESDVEVTLGALAG